MISLTKTFSFSTAPTGVVVGSPPYNVVGTSNRGLPVVLSALPQGVCSVVNSTVVTFVGVGVCQIDLDQAGNANYVAATTQSQLFNVGRGSQTISFLNAAPANAYVGGLSYSATALATSALPVIVSVAPASASICSVTGFTVSFLSNGTCSLTATQGKTR